MKVKKIIALLTMLVMIVSMVGCGSTNNKEATTAGDDVVATDSASDANDEAESDNTEDTASNDLSGTIVITGSTSVDKIVNDMIDEFTASNPDVQINYTATGSSAGIQDTIDGINTLGASSRALKEEEEAAGVKTEVFAYDGIAVVVHPSNEIQDISKENLTKIYSGEITNWSQIGGKDADIVVVSREGASGTRAAYEELIKLEDAGGLSEGATVVEGNGNVQATVAGNENAIGYVSFSFIDETVKPLTIDTHEATPENAKSGVYPLSRPFLFTYTDKTITPEAKAFLEFAKSADGQAFVEEHGGIKVD